MKNHLNNLLAIVILIIVIIITYLIAVEREKAQIKKAGDEAQVHNCYIEEAKISLTYLPKFCWRQKYPNQ